MTEMPLFQIEMKKMGLVQAVDRTYQYTEYFQIAAEHILVGRLCAK